jgi:hypothetical protein
MSYHIEKNLGYSFMNFMFFLEGENGDLYSK